VLFALILILTLIVFKASAGAVFYESGPDAPAHSQAGAGSMSAQTRSAPRQVADLRGARHRLSRIPHPTGLAAVDRIQECRRAGELIMAAAFPAVDQFSRRGSR